MSEEKDMVAKKNNRDGRLFGIANKLRESEVWRFRTVGMVHTIRCRSSRLGEVENVYD